MYLMNYKLLGVGRQEECRNRLTLADLLNFLQNYSFGFYTHQVSWGVLPSCGQLISRRHSLLAIKEPLVGAAGGKTIC